MASTFNIKIATQLESKGINELSNKFTSMSNVINNTNKNIDGLSKGLKTSKNDAEALVTALNKSYNADMGLLNLTEFNNSLKNAGTNIQSVQQSLLSCGSKGITAWNDLSSRIMSANSNLTKTGSVLDQISKTFTTAFNWNLGTMVFQGLVKNVSEAYNYVIDLDTSLNDIRIVTGQSAEEMASFAVEANNAAKALGATTLDYTNASLIYAQQGLEGEELKERARITTEVANVTHQSTDEISQRLTAVWNGYKVSASEAESYIDKLSNVAAGTASDLDQLSEAMSKVASAANVVGLDVDRLNAGISTVISVTQQSASKVGNSFKTILARMGDLALDFNNEDEFGVKLGDVSGTLEGMGVQVMKDNENMREMSDIIDDLGEKWQTLSAAQKQAAAVALGGKYQYNTLISWFDNYDMYKKALDMSMESEGALQKQQDTYMESMKAHLNQMQTASQSLYNTLVKPSDLNTVIDSFTKLIELVDKFEQGLGGGLYSLTNFASSLSMLFSKQIATGLNGVINKVKALKESATNDSFLQNLDRMITNSQAVTIPRAIENSSRADAVEAKASVSALQTQRNMYAEMLQYKRFLTEEEKNQLLDIQQKTYLIEKEKATLEGQSLIVNNIQTKQKEMAQTLITIQSLGNQINLIQSQYENDEISLVEALQKETTIRQQIFDLVKNQDILSQTEAGKKLTQNSQSLNLAELEEQAEMRILQLYNQEGLSQEQVNQIQTQVLNGKQNQLQRESDILRMKQQQIIADKQQIANTQRIVQSISMITSMSTTIGNLVRQMNNDSASLGEKVNTWGSSISQISMMISSFGLSSGNLLVGGIGVGVTLLSSILTPVISNWCDEQILSLEELESKMSELRESTPTMLQNISNLESLKDEYNELSKGVSDYGENISLTQSQYERYQEIVKEAISYSDEIVIGYNSEGEAIVSKNGLLEKEIELLKQKLELEQQELYTSDNVDTKSEGDKKKYDKAQKKANKAKDNLENGDREIVGNVEGLKTEFANIDPYMTKKNESYNKLRDALLENGNDYSKIYQEISQMTEEELNNAISDFEQSDKEYAKTFIDSILTHRNDLEKEFLTAKSQSEQQFVDSDFLLGLFQVNYTDTYDKLIKLGSSQAEGLLNAYINGLNFSDENVDYNQLAENVNGYTEELFQIFSNPDLVKDINLNSNNFESTYEEYIQNAIDIVNSHKEDFSGENGSLSEELIKNIFGLENISLDEEKQELINATDEIYNSVHDEVQDSLEKLEDKSLGGEIENYILGNFSREQLQNDIDTILGSLNFNAINEGSMSAIESLELVKKQINFSDEADQLRADVAMISQSLDALSSGEELTDDDLGIITSLEEEYEELGEIQDRTSEEYLNKLREIRSETEEGLIGNLVEEAEILQERLSAIDINVNPEEYFSVMDELQNTRIQIDVAFNANVDSTLEDTYDLIDRFSEAADLLTENYQITFEQASQLAKDGFSAMLVDAQSAGDGMIQLNSEVVHNFIQGRESELMASKKQKIAELQDEKTVLLNKKQILTQKLTALQTAAQSETDTEKAKNLVLAAQYQGDYDSYCAEVLGKTDKAEEGNVEISEDAARLTDFLGGNNKTQADNQIQAVDDADSAYSQGVNNAINYYSQLCAKLQEVSIGVRNAATGGPVSNNITAGISKMGISAKSSTPKKTEQIYEKTDNSAILQGDYDAVEETLKNMKDNEVNQIINDSIKSTQDSINDIDNQITAIDGAISVLNASAIDLKDKNENYNKNWKQTGATSGNPDNSPSAKKNKSNNKKSKSGGGNKGGSKNKKSKEKKEKVAKESDLIDEELDIYHDINNELEKINAKYEDLERLKEKTYGKKYLNAMEKEKNILLQQLALERGKLAIVKSSLKEEKAQLKGQYGIKFDAEGDIKNYNEQILKWQSYYNKKIKADPENEQVYKKKFEDFKDLMELYEDNLYKQKQETLDAIEETKDKVHEIELETFTYKIELKLNTKELKREWLEFCLEVSNYKYENLVTDNIVQTMRNSFNQLKTYLQKDGTLKTLSDSINNVIKSKSMTSKEKEELLTNYSSQIQEAYLQVQELKNTIQNAYTDAIKEASDRFSAHLDEYDRLDEKLEHEKKIIDLLYGETNYDLLGNLYLAQNTNNLNELDFLRKQVEYWSGMEGKFKEGTVQWEEWHKNLTQATEDLDSAIEDSLENVLDMFENAIDKVFSNLTEKLSGTSLGNLDYIAEEWDQIQYNAEKYLDTVESISGIENLISKIQKSIDETDSLTAKKKLKDLQEEELEYLSSKEQLTQYDLDRAEALYDVTLKQVALEEAKNAKDSMKLVRDTQGNYTYHYVADDDSISDAENELRDAQNSLYELDVEAYNENLSEMYDIYKEWQEKVKELYLDSSLTAEELELKKSEYAEYYGELITNICGENESIKNNLYSSTFDNLSLLYQEDSQKVTEWLNKLTGNNYTSWEQILNNSSSIMNKMNEGFGSMIQTMIDNISESPNSFKSVMIQTYSELDEENSVYETCIRGIQDVSGETFSDVRSDLNDVRDETRNLIDDNQDLIDTYDDMMTSIDNIYKNFGEYIGDWEQLEIGAKNATKAAQEYLQTLNKVNGNSSGDSSSTNSSSNKSNSSGSTGGTSTNKSATGNSKSSTGSSNSGDGKISKGEKVTLSQTPYYYDSYGTEPKGNKYKGKKVYVTNINTKGSYPYHVSTGSSLGNGDLGWVKKDQLTGFDTGGYTGKWGKEGKLALLHQKEIVLNQHDSDNMLRIMEAVREITKLQSSNFILGNSLTNGNTNNYNNTSSIHINNVEVNTNGALDFINELENISLQARQKINEQK